MVRAWAYYLYFTSSSPGVAVLYGDTLGGAGDTFAAPLYGEMTW